MVAIVEVLKDTCDFVAESEKVVISRHKCN